MTTGLLIFNRPFISKYGISPWNRFSDARLSEDASEATKCWNKVDAKLLRMKREPLYKGYMLTMFAPTPGQICIHEVNLPRAGVA